MSTLISTPKMLKTFLAILGSTVFVLTTKDKKTLIIATKRADVVNLILKAFPTFYLELPKKEFYEALWNSKSPMIYDLYHLTVRKLEVNKFYIIYGFEIKTTQDVQRLIEYIKSRPQVNKIKI